MINSFVLNGCEFQGNCFSTLFSVLPVILSLGDCWWQGLLRQSGWKGLWRGLKGESCRWDSFVVVQLLSCVWIFVTLWAAARQASLSFTVSGSLFRFMSIELVMYFTISSSAAHFSFCLPSFPTLGSFLMSQLFASGGQSTGVSAQHQSFQWMFRIDFL